MAWRIDKRITVARFTGAVIFALAAVVGSSDPLLVLIVGFNAVVLALFGVRDLIVPVRLAAGPTGVTVTTGVGARREIPWAGIEKIRVDARRGLVVRSQVLELDTADNLYFFTTGELGVPVHEVAEQLRIRSAR